jgi:hypothetical protein
VARTALAIQSPPGSYPTLPIGATDADFTFAAADTSNGNSFVSTGRELLLVNNSGGSAYTVTITSVADSIQRTGDITTYSIGAGLFSWFGPFQQAGWKQSDGTIYVDASNTAITFAVCRLPSVP